MKRPAFTASVLRAVEKFDEYLPDELLTKACAAERLAIEESQAALNKACSP
jgi:hypothetical protein